VGIAKTTQDADHFGGAGVPSAADLITARRVRTPTQRKAALRRVRLDGRKAAVDAI